MKLLITTQAIDKNDPILGFFHGWVEEFAKHFDTVEVVCLKEGEHALPPNVHVHSLGKEDGVSILKYVFRFYGYAWKLRTNYDIVFSHMNPHYIVLAGIFWRMLGKRMYFWRNHAKMNLMTRVAAFFATRVFYTSPHACTRIFRHAVQMPVGIDTERYTLGAPEERKLRTVLFLGRLSPVKRPELFAEAAAKLGSYTLEVYGDDPSGNDDRQKNMQTLAGGNLTFHGAVSNYETPRIYRNADVYVNLTPEGSMDKTVLEAAASGALPVVANRSFEKFLPPVCLLKTATPEELTAAITALVEMPESTKEQYRRVLADMVQKEHSLEKLVLEFKNIVTT